MMKKSLAKNAAFNIAYRLLNVVFPLISATYIARVITPEGVGKVAYAQNIVSYFLMFAVLGIPQYGTREVARVRTNHEEANRLFTELMIINLCSTMICCTVYYLFVGVFFSANTLIYLVCGLELILNLINIDWFYQGEEEYVYITVRSALIKILSLCALFLFVRNEGDYVIYALIVCMGTGGNYIFNVIHARKKVRLTFQGLNFRRHLKPIMALMLSAAAASLYSKVNITMLGWMATDEAVGYFSNANKVISIVLTLVTAISSVFLPRLSYIYENDRERYGEYLTIGVKIVLFLALPSCVGIMLVSEELTQMLFGVMFLPAVDTLRILAVFTIIKGVGDLLCYQAIISSGHEGKLILSRIIAGVANVILNAMLIPRYGHNGAAVASVISEVIVNGMLLPISRRITKIRIGKRFFGSTLLSVSVMTAAVSGVMALAGKGAHVLIFGVCMGVVMYFLTALLTKNEVLEKGIQMLRK